MRLFVGFSRGKFSGVMRDDLHSSLRPILIMAQWFGLVPLAGLRDGPEGLRFSWWSWRILHTLLVMCGISFCFAACFYGTIETGIRMFRFGEFC